MGRPSAELTPKFKKAYQDWKDGKISAVETTKQAEVGKTTFYKLVKRMEALEDV